MTLKFYKLSFLVFATICSIFISLTIPEKKAMAADYMFCPIFTNGGQPSGNGCYDSLTDCIRMSHADTIYKGQVICVAKPRNGSLSQ